jgi:hypothetical protein
MTKKQLLQSRRPASERPDARCGQAGEHVVQRGVIHLAAHPAAVRFEVMHAWHPGQADRRG